ncbi:hypothetical protein ACMG5N_20735, partial [Escherichia coli]
MLNLFVGLDIYTGLLLLLALAFVLFYEAIGNDSNLLIVFYVQIMPD